MADEDLAQQLSEVDLGLEAEQFFKSRLGVFLIQSAQQESDEVASKLKFVDPSDMKEIIRLQIKAQVAEAALKWLSAAIIVGKQSEFELRGNDYEE